MEKEKTGGSKYDEGRTVNTDELRALDGGTISNGSNGKGVGEHAQLAADQTLKNMSGMSPQGAIVYFLHKMHSDTTRK